MAVGFCLGLPGLGSFQGLNSGFESCNPFLQAVGFDLVEALLQTAQSFRDHHVFLFNPVGTAFQFFDQAMQHVNEIVKELSRMGSDPITEEEMTLAKSSLTVQAPDNDDVNVNDGCFHS